MVWKPNVTVAAVIEKDNKLLLVREMSDGETVINQPAGHLEYSESLLDAVRREVLEETSWKFEPEYLVGVYLLKIKHDKKTYLRFCFGGSLLEKTDQPIDDEIIETLWLEKEELVACQNQFRSSLVMKCINDYYKGLRYPLSILSRYQ